MKQTLHPQFTPEQVLLLWSIRVDRAKDQRITEILSSGIDWNYVRENAIQHGIIPLCYTRLKENFGDLVPSEELSKLKTLFKANAINNIRQTQHLIKVIDFLSDEGIEAITFKGPALTIQAYGDLSLRSFCDVDILIKRKDFDRVYRLLLLKEFLPQFSIDSHIKRKFALLKTEFFFIKDNFRLDLHWGLAQRWSTIPFDSDYIMENSSLVALNDREIRTMPPEVAVMFSCIHGNKHNWKELKWLADLIHLIAHHQDLQWNKILDHAEENHAKRILLIGLSLVSEYYVIKYPPQIEQMLVSDKSIKILVKKIQSNFFRSLTLSPLFTSPFLLIKSRDRIRDKLMIVFFYIGEVLFSPNEKDFNLFSLPNVLFPGYFILRPFRVLIEFFEKLFLITSE